MDFVPPGDNADQTITLLHVREIHRYNRWVMSYLEPFLRGRVLELGCGIGTYSGTLRRHAATLCCVDMDAGYARGVRALFVDDPGVHVVLGRLPGEVGFRPGVFDTVVCLNVLEHVEKAEEAVERLVAWLAPGGVLFIQVPAHRSLYGSIDRALGHYRRYARREVASLLAGAGLQTTLAPRHLYSLAVPGWWLYGRVLKRSSVPDESVRIANLLAGVSQAVETLVRVPLGLTIVAAGRKP